MLCEESYTVLGKTWLSILPRLTWPYGLNSNHRCSFWTFRPRYKMAYLGIRSCPFASCRTCCRSLRRHTLKDSAQMLSKLCGPYLNFGDPIGPFSILGGCLRVYTQHLSMHLNSYVLHGVLNLVWDRILYYHHIEIWILSNVLDQIQEMRLRDSHHLSWFSMRCMLTHMSTLQSLVLGSLLCLEHYQVISQVKALYIVVQHGLYF